MKKIARDHLHNMDDRFAGCKGDSHDFPKLRPNKKWPKGVSAVKQVDGTTQLIYVCPDCGTVRRRDTLRNGLIVTGPEHRYDYKHPKGYLAPKGAGLTKADYARELANRLAPMVKEATRAGGQPPVPQPKRQAKPRGNSHATNPRAKSHIRQSETKLQHEWEQSHGKDIPQTRFSGSAS